MTLLRLSDDLAAAAERLARPRRLRAPLAIAFVVLAAGGAGAAATDFWQPQLGDHRRGHPTASASDGPREQLERFAVLRRPANEADRGPQVREALTYLGRQHEGIRTNSVRVVGEGQQGRPVILVPAVSAHGKPDALCLYAVDVEGSGGSCWTTQEILDRTAILMMGPPPPENPVPCDPREPGSCRPPMSPMTLMGLVPDGVRAVSVFGSPPVEVRDNFFRATVDELTADRTVEWVE
jgi:hypothetical protein